ncbi:MAG TPA: hypothetical protein VMC03_01405 [Streptosporangiaceae bacterium]|nr:hypothetical protein [Streptosporangiaceae bacterium]
MKASPAERAEPDRGPVIWHPALAVLAWAAYFASLIAVYLIAFGKHSHACQSASVWAMVISLAIVLVTLPFASARLASRPGLLSPAGMRAAFAGPAIVTGAVLAVVSVAVIWTAINLTVETDPAGAWALSVPVAVAPVVFLVTLLISPSAVAVAEAPEAEVPEAEAPEVEAPEVEAPGVEVPGELEKPPVPEGVTSTGLLSADWRERVDSETKVALDAALWHKTRMKLAEQSTELGGLALTVRAPGVLLIVGIVFPKQISANLTRCVFPTVELDRVRRAIDAVADEVGIAPGDITVTWVHTHPRIGVWLSGTDKNTTRKFRSLDADFTPIVIDPHEDSLASQIGVFDSASEKIEPLDLVDGLADRSASVRLARSLAKTYRDDGRSLPIILLPGAAGR